MVIGLMIYLKAGPYLHRKLQPAVKGEKIKRMEPGNGHGCRLLVQFVNSR